MHRLLALLAIHGASAFLAPPTPAAARTIVFKKKDKDAADDAEPVQINAMSKGTVVERAPAPDNASRRDHEKNTRAGSTSTSTRRSA